jgi:hypothetical protein
VDIVGLNKDRATGRHAAGPASAAGGLIDKAIADSVMPVASHDAQPSRVRAKKRILLLCP